MDTEELDITKLKYVLYARKSTEDETRQIRSMEDQIAECRDLAKRLRLHVVESPILEEKSAKKPHKRPLFRQIINDIKKGKYDGILSWNPDRLARNMLEGGEIIDLVDQGVIKDLKFVTHHFTKDANGKMLLGMAFVLSKQYSDKLSQDVTRGVKRNLAEGKTPTYKYGYLRDKDGLQRPDGKNFDLICQAWQMRKLATSLEAIADFLNNHGYARITKSKKKKIKITKQMLSDMFNDPFYYGILIQTHQEVILKDIYNFKPAITEQDYMEVQRLSGIRINPYKKKMKAYIPLRMMVSCNFCGSHMYGAPSKGNTKKYLFFRCDNKYCTRKKRSIRSNLIFDFIYKFLADGLNFTENEYQQYLKSMTFLSGDKREKASYDIHSKEARIKSLSREMQDISYKILDFEKDSIVRTINNKKLEENQEELEELKANVTQLKSKLTSPEQEAVSFQQFLNLSKNAAKAVQLGDAIVKDIICRLIFLNFSVDQEKVVSYQLKEPFDTLLKHRKILSSRGEKT